MPETTQEDLTPEDIWDDAILLSGDMSRTEDGCVSLALLLASAFVGPDGVTCADFLGLPYERVSVMVNNLEKNGVWKDGLIHSDWVDEELGQINLILDSAVAMGLVERAPERRA